MSEHNIPKQEAPEQLSDILLVLDKEKKKIQAVKGIGEDGELETIAPTKKNQNQFMRVDRQGDLFSNFFSNFISQLKNPTHFNFFNAPLEKAIQRAKELQKHIDSPTDESEKILSESEVKIEEQKDNKKKNNMETTQKPSSAETSEYRYQPEQIDWETMSNLGLSKEKLEKMNILEPLLKGYKTNQLVPVTLNLGTAITRMDARLSLQPNQDGEVAVAIHGIRKEPNLHSKFFGHEFSKEDKENLLKTGNMGRIVPLTNLKTGDEIPSIISVDRLTNELIALRADRIKIPDEFKGVKLNDEQKQTLMDGKPLYLEGMISKKGEPFNATVQFNADKRYVEFLFDNNLSNKTQQNKTTEAPRTIRGKELSDEQYEKFKAGQSIYVNDLKSKEGNEYKGYLTYNKETGKTTFSFNNPKSAQKQSDSKKQQEQQDKPKAPRKARGKKM